MFRVNDQLKVAGKGLFLLCLIIALVLRQCSIPACQSQFQGNFLISRLVTIQHKDINLVINGIITLLSILLTVGFFYSKSFTRLLTLLITLRDSFREEIITQS